MTRRHVALSLAVAALLVTVVLPASAQGAREQASLTDLLGLLQSDDATADELKAALARVEEILGFQPPPCESGQDRMFNDVPASNPFCPFIEEMARRGITSGCGNNNFCPGNAVTRAQMATFIVKTLGEAAWHGVTAPGEPGFGHPDAVFCEWNNFDFVHSRAAFLRDGDGFVHLKGVVEVTAEGVVEVTEAGESECELSFNCDLGSCLANRTIFVLPDGFRPMLRQVLATLANGVPARITVYPSDTVVTDASGTWDLSGAVVADPPTTYADADQWISLDGISFRCDSAEPGCS